MPFLLLLLPIAAAASDATLDLSTPFVLLDGSDPNQLSRELERASAAGHRVVSTSTVCREVSFWGPSGRAVLLEKSEGAAAAHACMVVRMLPPQLPLKRWHEVLDGPGFRGFRFVPGYSTFTCRNFPLWEGGPAGMVWVLDKSPDARRFEYRIGAPGSAKALYEEIDAGEKTGFEIAAMLPLDGMLILVMERELDKAAAPLAGMTDGRLIVLEKVSTSAGR